MIILKFLLLTGWILSVSHSIGMLIYALIHKDSFRLKIYSATLIFFLLTGYITFYVFLFYYFYLYYLKRKQE